jgi:hypothetical protein
MASRAIEHIDYAERFVIAAMLKHMCLIKEAKIFSNCLSSKQPLPSVSQAKFNVIGKKTGQVISWVRIRAQMENEWQDATQKNEDITYFDTYKQDPQKLLELCELKNVEFNLMETEETVKLLFKKLKEDIDNIKRTENYEAPNPYEVTTRPIIERMKFLIKLVPSGQVYSPAAETPNPYSIDPNSSSALRASEGDILDIVSRSDVHPLSRSFSSVPLTTTSIEREKQKQVYQQKGKEFSRRVGELRKWIQAYNGWKKWQDGSLEVIKGLQEPQAPPSSPLQAVVSFANGSTISTNVFERLIRTQVSRANSRVQGLKDLHQVLGLCSFGSVR